MHSTKSSDAGKIRVPSGILEANKVAHVGREEADGIELSSTNDGFGAEPSHKRNACRMAQGVSELVLKTFLDSRAGVGSRPGGKKTDSALLERTEKVLYSITVVLISRRHRSDKPVFTKEVFPMVLKSLVSMTEAIYLAGETGEEYKFVKYYLNVLQCKVLSDPELPPRPPVVDRVGLPLFTGYLLRHISRSVARKDLAFVTSLSKGTAKMWLPPSDKDVIAAYVKQMKCLTKTPAEPTDLYNSTLLQVVDRLFVGPKWVGAQNDAGNFMNPTGRAGVGAPLAKGGTRQKIEAFIVKPRDVVTSLEFTRDEWAEVKRVFKIIGAPVPAQRELHKTGMGSLKEVNSDFAAHIQREFSREAASATTLLSELDSFGVLRGNLTEAVPVKEPAKVRVITKMVPEVANAMRPPQEDLREGWLRHGGNTMDEKSADLSPKIQQLCEIAVSAAKRLPFLRGARGQIRWDSHDFDSATEYVSPKPAQTVLNYLADRIDGPRSAYFRLLARTFEDRWVSYKIPDEDWDYFQELVKSDEHLRKPGVVRFVKRYESNVESGRVVAIRAINGQPMGNPLSFSLLCITNLAGFSHAVRLYSDEFLPVADELTWEERKLTKRYLLAPQLKIVPLNGDDIVFVATRGFSELFRHVSRSNGFVTAIGKSFRSTVGCCINSQWFQNVGSDDPVTWAMQPRGYLSLKLFAPVEMRKGSEGPLSPYEAATTLDAMVAKTPWTAAITAGVFLRNEFLLLGKRLGYTPNWGLPRQLGGWGCRSVVDTRVTKAQRLVAASLAVNGGAVLTRKSEVYMRKVFPGAFGTRLFVPAGSEKDPTDTEPSRWWNIHPGAVLSDEIGTSQWSDRLLMIYQWTPEARKERDMEILCNPVKRDYRLSPMSDEAIAQWWDGFWVQVPGPDCPALPRAMLPH